MDKKSAGILLFKKDKGNFYFFLVHPGGPFWVRKDFGAWSVPKGEFENEEKLIAAKREFKEETSISIDEIPSEKFIELEPVKLTSGKTVFAFALEMEIDPSKIKSNTFSLGPKEYPEVDKGEWFDTKTALSKINQAQRAFILELTNRLQS